AARRHAGGGGEAGAARYAEAGTGATSAEPGAEEPSPEGGAAGQSRSVPGEPSRCGEALREGASGGHGWAAGQVPNAAAAEPSGAGGTAAVYRSARGGRRRREAERASGAAHAGTDARRRHGWWCGRPGPAPPPPPPPPPRPLPPPAPP